MPANFEACVRRGGRVRTRKLGKGRYVHVCFADGQSWAGEVKTTEEHKELMRGRKKPRTA